MIGSSAPEIEQVLAAMSREPVREPATRYREGHVRLMADDVLLGKPRSVRSRRHSGLIVIPTSRPLANSAAAFGLAGRLSTATGWDVLVVCSRDAKARDVEKLQSRPGPEFEVVDFSAVDPRWKCDFVCDEHVLARLNRRTDTGAQRNLGLAVAARRGLEFVLFVDDDISSELSGETLDADGLLHALGRMEQEPERQVIGWYSRNQPDNSVIGHLRRHVGLPQWVFLGGGALLTRLTPETPFFPDIYNEDWLFLMPLIAAEQNERTAVGCAGSVVQNRYTVYRAHRSRSEEAGDQLAECLMNLLEDHGGTYVSLAKRAEFWSDAQRCRRQMIKEMQKGFSGFPASTLVALSGDTGQSPWKVLGAALKTNAGIPADLFVDFIKVWERDLRTWAQFLARASALPDRVEGGDPIEVPEVAPVH